MSTAPLPIIRGTSAANYPFDVTYSFLTGVSQFQNGSEQRIIRRPGALIKVSIPYAQLTQTQKNTVKAAFTSAAGRFEQNITLTLGATTYLNLGLDSDEWSATETKTTQYVAPLKLTQSITQNLSPGTPGQPFPTLANGSIGMLPYTQKRRYQTVAQKVDAGPIYTFPEFGGPLSGYPGVNGLGAWEFGASMLTDADTATLVAHFIANWGRAYNFTYTDEDAVAYTKTHYAMDDLVVTYRGVNESSMKISLEATG